MTDKIRKTPVICLIIAVIRLLYGSLRFSKRYANCTLKMESGKIFTIFRHITIYPLAHFEKECIFIVSFKFSHLSHKANKITSIIPMLMIAGFPGFIAKLYAVNPEDGYWQGMYQWKSIEHLNYYKKSLVFKMMIKRALKDSITLSEIKDKIMTEFIDTHKI